MSSIVRPILQRCSRRWNQKDLNLLVGTNKSGNFQSIRYYKDFGHARQIEPLGTRLFLMAAVFFISIGGFRFVHEWSDVYEEGEDRGKQENERTYRVDI